MSFHLCDYIPRSEIAGYMVIQTLTFWKTSKLFSTVTAPFHLPINIVCENSNLFKSLSRVVIWLYDSSHPTGSEVVSHCCVNLHFPHDAEHLFLCFLVICVFSLEKYEFKFSFLIGLFVFLLLSYKNFL